ELIGTLGYHTLYDEIHDISKQMMQALNNKDEDLALEFHKKLNDKRKTINKIIQKRNNKSSN
ncbi:MAG TPA: hypothetical protein VJ878_02250, partial [Candidatus Izemoplasmatales bacterium]|nr:hypothetical protein [Candidatus Izemoplasmatales bacterium]